MSSTQFTDALPAGSKILWFEILKVLGKGGFGITYLGRDANQDQLVAVKEYLPTAFASRTEDRQVHPNSESSREKFEWGLKRFLKEAQTLARFRHPAIVRVVSFFRDSNTAYMVMEYVEGEGLDVLLKRKKTLSEEELRKVLPPLLDGLEVLHNANFIHRDIKPPNILIRQDGSPVILDFGAARQSVGDDMTSLLSLGYSPFEQYDSSGERQGPWSDIYAMGGVLYRCISGRKPSDAAMRIASRLRNDDDPMKAAVEIGKDRYSPTFLAAIDKALEVLETDRPQSIREWRKMLGVEAMMAPFPVAKKVLNRGSVAVTEAEQQEIKRKKSSWRSFIASINEFSTQGASQPDEIKVIGDNAATETLPAKRTPIEVKKTVENMADAGARNKVFEKNNQEKVSDTVSTVFAPIALKKRDPSEISTAVPGTLNKQGVSGVPILVPGKTKSQIVPEVQVDPLTKSEFVRVAGGTFRMGSAVTEKGRKEDEGPVHNVTLKEFWFGKVPVTWKTWNRVMGDYPKGIFNLEMAMYPVERVSWNMVQKFLERLNKHAKGTKIYRLPTEAEWEYAARAGTVTTYPFSGGVEELEAHAWIRSNSDEKTHPVAGKLPNQWGFYDMLGNVWEWIADGYDENFYKSGDQDNPKGPDGGDRKSLRGGCWRSHWRECRCANRMPVSGKLVSTMVGFRLVMERKS